MSRGYVNNRFASLYYRGLGQGIPLIMLHGSGESHEIFSRLVGLMSRYYRVILVDSRGHDAPHLKEEACVQELTTPEMTEGVVQVMEVFHVSQIMVLGFNDGANVALETTSQYPDKVPVAVTVSGNALPGGMDAFFYVQVRAKYVFWHVMERIPLTGPVREWVVAGRQLNDLIARWSRPTKTQLSRTQAPVLIPTGRHGLTRSRHSLWMGEQITDAKVVFVEGADHFTFLKKEEVYASHIAVWSREKGL